MASALKTSGFSDAQLRTIKDTVASDTNNTEFSLFMEACQSYGLDPFRRQINAVVFSKNDEKKRRMSIIVSRDGLRVIASRCGDYRPRNEPAEIEYDESLISDTNPKGIVTCTVYLWKQDKGGDWYKVIGEADWDEFAPVKQKWEYSQEQNRRVPTDSYELEQGSWQKMPKVMIVKCAETQALRAGWPDQFGGIYAEEEMHRAHVEESAAVRLENHEKAEREKRVGGPGVMMVFDDTGQLKKIPMGEVFDRVAEFIKVSDPEEVYKFQIRNEDPLREFWAQEKGAALQLKKLIEAKTDTIGKA